MENRCYNEMYRALCNDYRRVCGENTELLKRLNKSSGKIAHMNICNIVQGRANELLHEKLAAAEERTQYATFNISVTNDCGKCAINLGNYYSTMIQNALRGKDDTIARLEQTIKDMKSSVEITNKYYDKCNTAWKAKLETEQESSRKLKKYYNERIAEMRYIYDRDMSAVHGYCNLSYITREEMNITRNGLGYGLFEGTLKQKHGKEIEILKNTNQELKNEVAGLKKQLEAKDLKIQKLEGVAPFWRGWLS